MDLKRALAEKGLLPQFSSFQGKWSNQKTVMQNVDMAAVVSTELNMLLC